MGDRVKVEVGQVWEIEGGEARFEVARIGSALSSCYTERYAYRDRDPGDGRGEAMMTIGGDGCPAFGFWRLVPKVEGGNGG